MEKTETGDLMVSVNAGGDNKVMVRGFNIERFNTLVGKVLNMVEVLGLNPAQESAFKCLLKQEIWDLWDRPWCIEEKEKNFY